jgi:hypothetical protein
MTASTETIEKLALFFDLAHVYASLGDAIGEQLRGWAAADFEADPEPDEDGYVDGHEPTAGAMGYVRERLGSRSDEIAELLDIDAEEVRVILNSGAR